MNEAAPNNLAFTRWMPVCFAVVLVAYWLVSFDFSPDKKVDSIDSPAEYHSDENEMADQQRQVTSTSAVGFIALGGLGAACVLGSFGRSYEAAPALLMAAAAYVGLCYTSVLWSVEPAFTVRKLGVFTFFLIGVVGISRVLSIRQIGVTLGAVAFTATAISLLAEIAAGRFTPWAGAYRFAGVGEPNGQALLCCSLGLAALFLWSASPQSRYVAALVLSFAVMTLLLTKSRTGLAAFLIASAAGLSITWRASTKLLAGGVALLVIGMMLLAVASSGSAAGRDAFSIVSMGRTEHVTEMNGRLPLWTLLLGEVRERPLIGHGYSAFWTARNIEEVSDEFFWHIPQGHSIFIDMLLQLGAVGLIVFLAMVLLAVHRAALLRRRTGDHAYAFALSMIVLGLVNGISESKYIGSGFECLVFYSVVCGLALREATAQETARAADRAPTAERRLFPAVEGGRLDPLY